MREKLTPGFVEKAEAAPGADRTIYWDESLRGFGLMVTARGHKGFVVQYRASKISRRLHLTSALPLDKARREARKIIGAVAEGRDPLTERRKEAAEAANTLRSVAEEYFAREGGRLRTIDQRRATFERLIFPKFGTRQIDSIRRSEIVRLLDRIEDESGPVMADHTLAYLRRLMTWHAGRSDDFRSPIVRGMARTKPTERRRKRVLSDDELQAVWRTSCIAPGPFGAFIQFLLVTAARRNEAARMVRAEVCDGVWTIPSERYKTGLELVIPLSAVARAVLARIPKVGRGNLVFTTDGKRPMTAFSKFKRKFDGKVLEELRKHDPSAKPLPRWTLHDLRRTARSLMSRAGVPSDHAERALGHVIVGVRGTYDRYDYLDEKRRAFEAVATLIERIVHPRDNVVIIGERLTSNQAAATGIAL
jgi:integrase